MCIFLNQITQLKEFCIKKYIFFTQIKLKYRICENKYRIFVQCTQLMYFFD